MDERKNIFPCTLNLPFYILNFTFAPLRRAGAGIVWARRECGAWRAGIVWARRECGARRVDSRKRQAAHIFTSISEKTEYFFK